VSEFEFPELKAEKRKWMFWLARIFGKRINEKFYSWRGKLWYVG